VETEQANRVKSSWERFKKTLRERQIKSGK
jgi:hypothetical protein